jgi:glycosyltransferase involved in cell wall biosynthesis
MSQGLKITIVTGAFLPIPPGPAGAVEKMWARLADEFAKRGHTVTLVSRSYKGLAEKEDRNGVCLLRKSGFSRTGRSSFDLTLDLLYTISVIRSLPKGHVVITNTFFLPILTGPLARYLGKTVVDVQRFPKGQLWLYSQSARLRTTSNAVHEAARKELPSAGHQIKQIPNAVDLALFCPPESPRPRASEGVILYAGRIHPEKGVHLLVRAFGIISRDFPSVKLVLVGPQGTNLGGGGTVYLSELERLALGLPLFILPPISEPARLAQKMKEASIFCYPSLAEAGESFPVAPLEAMATGLPTVVSKLSVFDGLIEDGSTGLIFDHKSDKPEEALASKLKSLLLDDDLQTKIGHQAARESLQFGYETIAEAFLNDFASLV